MNIASYILGIAAALLVLIAVIEMLRRGKLRERHTLWWLIAGSVGLVIGFFPSLLEVIATALGIEVPLNLVFFLGVVVLFLVCLQQSSELTRLEERSRVLAEQVALLDARLNEIEHGLTGDGSSSEGHGSVAGSEETPRD